MLRVTILSLAAVKGRFALTAAAIALGVAFVTGTLVLTDTATRLFDEQFQRSGAGVDLVVRSRAEFGAAMGVEVEREPVPASAATAVAALPGVRAVQPAVQGQALLFSPSGAPIVPSGASVGLSWAEPPFSAFTLRAGAAPRGPDEMVVDAATAAAHGIDPGDTVRVQGRGEPTPFRVVGVAAFGEGDGLPNTTVTFFSIDTARALFDVEGGVSQLLVLTDQSSDTESVRARIEAALGTTFEVQSSRDTAAASADAAKEQLSFVRAMLVAIAGTALLLAGFLIANTFSVTVAQRLRELAVLRAVGATGRQTLRLVLTEAAVIGAVASSVGAGLGVAAAVGMRGLVARFGVTLPDGPLVIAPRTLSVAMTVGVVVTLLSAIGPARRASRVAPVQAMRQAEASSRAPSRARLVTGVVTAAGAVALAVAAVTGPANPMAVAPVVLLVVVALATLGPRFAGRLARAAGAPLDRFGVAGRLARGSAERAPGRTAATMNALAVGLAVVTFMTVLGASMKATSRAGLEGAVKADLVIESARGEMLGGLSPHVHHRVSELPEVGAISRVRYGHWQLDGATKALSGIDVATLPEVVDLDMVRGQLADLGPNHVLLADNVAAELGMDVGDALPMTFARTGQVDLRVAGVFKAEDMWAVGTAFLVSLETFAGHFTEEMDAAVFVAAAEGVPVARLRAAVSRTLEEFPTAVVLDQDETQRARTAAIDRILGLVTALLLLAVLIALLGITNTLALSIVERTREIGLLRAVGMTSEQARSMIRWEAVLVAVLGATLGIALGAGLAWVALQALSGQAVLAFTAPGGRLGLYLAVAVTGGLLAGLLPARRAARLDVLDALAAG